MWQAIKTGAKAFFGSPVAKDGLEIVKGVGKFIDEQKFTEQEKAEFDRSVIPLYAKFIEKTLNENTERSKTRRHLSVMVVRNWWAMLWFMLLVWPWRADYAAFVATVVFNGTVAVLVLGIGAFFWGTHMLRTTKLSKE